MTSDLYKIRNIHPSFNYNSINYIKGLFNAITSQNQGKPTTIRERLLSIPLHVSGDHTSCDSSWCKALALEDPSKYQYKSLAHKRPISKPDVITALKDVFQKYANKADQLSRLGSSQANESLNNAVARKAPKSQHFSASQSLYYRVSATVAEKNKGSNYTLEVCVIIQKL